MTPRPAAPLRVTSSRLPLADRPAVVRAALWPLVLSGFLVPVAAVGCAVPLLAPAVLRGPAVTAGNLRGTALVVLAVGLPALVAGAWATARHSARGLVVWLGAQGYVAYQAVLFCLGTPMNRLFLLHVAWLALSVWTLLVTLSQVDVRAWASRAGAGLPARGLATAVAAVAVLTALAWLARTVPDAVGPTPGAVLDGSGMTASPVWVQDLAVWVPAAVVVAGWAWRRRPAGLLGIGAFLVVDAVELLGIASDQWFGARADAGHPDLASAAAVPPFLVGAAVLAVLAVVHLRHVDAR